MVDRGGDGLHVSVFEAIVWRDLTSQGLAFDEGAVADQAGHIEGVARGDLGTCPVLPDIFEGHTVAVVVRGRR